MTGMVLRKGALALAAATLLSALPIGSADAQWYPPRRNHTGEAIAGGVVGGVLGGLAAGAIINSTRPSYALPVEAPPPVYMRPAPVYVEPQPHYVPSCYVVRRKVWLDDYAYTYRRERVCD
jgi:hypothetical protein